jgi:quercetin dioxygenase-like cupin family protein
MNSSWKVLASTIVLIAVCLLGSTRANADEVKFASADKADFKDLVPGVTQALLWSDDTTGAHGAFTKFKPGQDNGMHKHSSDTWLVVLKGAYLYKDENGEKRVAEGDFIRIPGGHPHWSGGDQKDGALFYQEGAGKFDRVPVK